MGIWDLLGLNSLAFGFKVDFFTWLKNTKSCSSTLQKSLSSRSKVKSPDSKTYSATPSVLSVVSDLTSSLPGVLAGWGVAGDCLSEISVVFVAAAEPSVVVVSLMGSSVVAGECWGCDGLGAGGWALGSEAGWASDEEGLVALCRVTSPTEGGVAAAGDVGELELPVLGWSWKTVRELRYPFLTRI